MIALPLLLAGALVLQDDPELRPEGRTHFLGREIARTMHWRGADWLLRETREDEENGVLLREWLDVRSPMVVCDFGCGNGYHTLPLARAVQPEGRVVAVDLQPEMLALLGERAAAEGIAGLEVVRADVDDPHLSDGSLDLALLVDVYHELSHPVSTLAALRRALRPEGRIVLVEFRAEDPAVPILREHKMSRAQVVGELAVLGFRCVDAWEGLPWQHVLAFAPAGVEPLGDEARGVHAATEVATDAWRCRAAGATRELGGFLAAEVEDLAGGSAAREAWLEQAGARGLAGALPAGGAPPCVVPGAARAWLHGDGGGGCRESVRLARDPDGAGLWRVDAWARARGLVAMNTATGRGTPAEQVALAAETGYAGIAWGIWRTAEVRDLCAARGIALAAVAVALDVTQEEDARVAPLAEAIAALPQGAQVWLTLDAPGAAASDPALDERARALVLTVAERGAKVVLYPHHGSWMERFEDALRLAEALDRPEVGVAFNLCHWLREAGPADPAPLLERAGARLALVTVHGADADGKDWPTLIRPLDAGTYELAGLLATLDRLGFAGTFALQGFGLKEPPAEHLARSMAAWWKLGAR